MPSKKRRLAELENQKKKIAKHTHAITGFFNTPISSASDQDLVTSSDPATDTTSMTATDHDETACDKQTPKTGNTHHHKVGINKDWIKEYPWLIFVTEEDDGEMRDVMLCSLCKKHETCAANGSAVWSKVGYKCLRKDKVQMHQDSEQHALSLTAEMSADMDEMVTRMNSVALHAVRDALKMLYFILQHNLSLSLFEPMLKLCIDLGATNLPNLYVGGNAKYTSWDIVQDLLSALSDKVEDIVLEEMRASPCYSTMVDEVMDIRSVKHLAICAKYVNRKAEVKTVFLTDVEMPDARADSITATMTSVLDNRQLNGRDMVGFASDGAAVFTGRKNGVAKQLKDVHPHLLTHHCRDHRLALACRDSFASLPSMKKADKMLENLYKYYKYSCRNTDSLKNVQKAFDEAPISIKVAKHHRWLSHSQAVLSLVRAYKSVVVDLESSGISSDPVGHGLLKDLKDPVVLRTLLFLADVLPHLSTLSLVFQKQNVHLGNIKTSVDKTLKLLEKRKLHLGPWMAKEEQLRSEAGIIQPVETDFDSKIRVPFIDALTDNIRCRFEDVDTIEHLSVLDLTGTDVIETMHGYTEMENLAQIYGMEPADLLLQWQDFLELLSTSDKLKDERSLPDLHKLFHAPEHKTLNLQQMYPLVSQLLGIAIVQPLSTAEVERVFSQLKLIKTSHRNNMKTSTLTKILNIKMNCDQQFFDAVVDHASQRFSAMSNRRLFSSSSCISSKKN